MRKISIVFFLGAGLVVLDAAPQWSVQTSGVSARLRGVSAVSDQVAWASGTQGTVVRTIDGGRTWQRLAVPNSGQLDFRDIDAIDEHTAYALSIGPGESSRIYKTTDGGERWELRFTNKDPKAFYDAMAFWDADRGIAVSDSVDGRFVVLTTVDGGRSWLQVPDDDLPTALPGEGAFAASGTNVAVAGKDRAWIATGASTRARVLRSNDSGRTWKVSDSPLPSGPSAGIFSIAFRDSLHGVIVGGDYRKETEAFDNVAKTTDGGATWVPVKERGLLGFRSVVAYVPGAKTPTLIAVGPSGADYSVDDGQSWVSIPGPGFHAFSFAPNGGAGWGVGERGAIARLRISD